MKMSIRLLTLLALTLVAALPATAAPVAGQSTGPSVCDPLLNGAWTAEGGFPDPGMVRAVGVWFPDNGRFYAMGGRTSDGVGSNLLNPHEYDPVGMTWITKTAVFSDGQVNNMVGGVLDFGGTDYIVVVGGSAAGNTTATSEVRQYDPVADVMTTLTSDAWPQNATGDTLPGGGAVHNNKLYVFGGFQISIGMINTIWEFDPAAAAGSRWTLQTATLPVQLGYVPAATQGNYIYTFGGSEWDGATLVDSTSSSRYDPVGDVIAAVSPAIPRATGETRAVTQFDGKIWVLGGGRTAPNPSGEVNVYDPVANAWTTGPAIPTARRNFAADIDPATGRIWAAGGYATAAPTTVTEVFDPNCVPTSVRLTTLEASSQDGALVLWLSLAAVAALAATTAFGWRRRRA